MRQPIHQKIIGMLEIHFLVGFKGLGILLSSLVPVILVSHSSKISNFTIVIYQKNQFINGNVLQLGKQIWQENLDLVLV